MTGLKDADTAVELSPVTESVAANTPLLIKGAGTYLIPLAASGSDISGTNKLMAVTANNTEIDKENGNTKYVLTVQNEEAVFARINETSATLNKGQAYLQLSGQHARSLNIGYDDETIGIHAVNSEKIKDNSYYDLQGRRVAQPTKGLYIVNGRKVVIK